MQKIITTIFITILALSAFAQQVLEGRVVEKGTANALPGANIYLQDKSAGTSADADGDFTIQLPGGLPVQLVVSFIGYQPETLTVKSTYPLVVELNKSVELQEVNVESKVQSTYMSKMEVIQTERISAAELKRSACCNLSESFETNATVDVSYTDAVTGAKEIQMLGLAGVYTQMLAENIPANRGPANIYGLLYFPGPWINAIQVSKGSSSVVNGYDGITGAINLEYKKPLEDERFYLNLYGASTGNTEINLSNWQPLSNKLSTMLLVHGEYFDNKPDKNEDGFLDMPQVKQYNLMNRWVYFENDKIEVQFGVKYLEDLRSGGQLKFNRDTDEGTTNAYGISVNTKRAEAFSKIAFPAKNKPFTSTGLILSFAHHDQNSFYGLKTYDVTHNLFYANLIHQTYFGTTDHVLKVGGGTSLNTFDEQLSMLNMDRNENVVGAFIEYHWKPTDKFSVITGFRTDYNSLYDMIYTPRINMKYDISDALTIRAATGKAFRSPNVIADNPHILASSRDIVIGDDLKGEEAWTSGGGLMYETKFFGKPLTLSGDYYNTWFTKQVVVDPYTHSNMVMIYNLDGKSYSNSWQGQVVYEAHKNLDLRMAYRRDDVFVEYTNIVERKPLSARDKVVATAGYSLPKGDWKLDMTWQWTGKKSLPLGTQNHNDERVLFSEPYHLLFAQLSKKFKNLELYAGVENLTDFMQQDAIRGADDPFGDDFDAAWVWGPLMGRKIYGGLRWMIP